jgi:deoxyribodipyrimidine photolyase-related protein
MEFFYREMRKRLDVLMQGGNPAGGEWNFDAENRGVFGKNGPELLPAPVAFAPDLTTRSVMEMVDRELPEAPGTSQFFDFPVTRHQALEALSDFIANRLPHFGQYQDAMWSGQPWLYHARLSAALNLKLINPREVIAAAENSWNLGLVPIAAAEGFIRQILGWREYVRGIYWRSMPEYMESNALDARAALPGFYWTGETDMHCLKQAIGQTLKLGYAHHIQRLMVTGLYALLLGVRPSEVHEWYLGVYVDAVEWVEVPNTIGMSQYADGGVMASKPYAASGKYIQRMSDYCRGCVYDPALSVGEKACPFTTLYWDFLARNRARLGGNQRMSLQLKNLDRLTPETLEAVRLRAAQIKGI